MQNNKIDGTSDFTPRGLGQLKAWLEPWFGTKGGGTITWEDVGAVCSDGGDGGGGGGTLSLPSFALTGNNPANVAWGDEEFLNFGGSNGHFSTTDDTVFDQLNGQARIHVPGFYVIRLSVNTHPLGNVAVDSRAQIALKYSPVSGGSIEQPWYIGYLQPGGGEQTMDGSLFIYPSGTGSSYDILLTRLHPISLTDAATFPVSITPTLLWNAGGNPTVNLMGSWLGLWGFRVGDNLDAIQSD